jgi:hypothetical protein
MALGRKRQVAWSPMSTARAVGPRSERDVSVLVPAGSPFGLEVVAGAPAVVLVSAAAPRLRLPAHGLEQLLVARAEAVPPPGPM